MFIFLHLYFNKIRTIYRNCTYFSISKYSSKLSITLNFRFSNSVLVGIISFPLSFKTFISKFLNFSFCLSLFKIVTINRPISIYFNKEYTFCIFLLTNSSKISKFRTSALLAVAFKRISI